MSDTSIEAAVLKRLDRHVRDQTFNSDIQGVIVLGVEETQSAYRGAEQVYLDAYQPGRVVLFLAMNIMLSTLWITEPGIKTLAILMTSSAPWLLGPKCHEGQRCLVT